MTDKIHNLNDYLGTLQVKAILSNYTECNEWWQNFNFLPDYYRIYYITEGEGWIKVGDHDLYPRKGEMYWLPANIPQQYSLKKKDSPMILYWVHFYATLGGQIPLLNIINLPYCIKITREEDRLCETFIKLLNHMNQPSGVANELLVKSNVLTLMSYFINHCENEIVMPLASPMYGLAPAIRHIESHLTDEITVNQLAGIVNLHPNYFSEKFRKLMGMSPNKYIIHKRIERAKALLIYTGRHISDIAEESGFSDQFQFSSLFRKYASMSPKEFRNTYKTIKNP